jgi:hypothetical protein
MVEFHDVPEDKMSDSIWTCSARGYSRQHGLLATALLGLWGELPNVQFCRESMLGLAGGGLPFSFDLMCIAQAPNYRDAPEAEHKIIM